jgi:DNA/RNA-binding domain of Phe-tRNA-synthetase-like protein
VADGTRPFVYSTEILDRFPTTRGGVIHATELRNGPSPDDLVAEFRTEQDSLLARLGDTPLADLPSIAAWRRVFTAFGVKPTQYRNAAEALMRRLTKQGSLPSINLLVDLANLVSIRYALPVAVFDQAAVTGGTTVRFANGSERFTDLGGDGSETPPEPGEVIFVDAAGLVSARRWCWRQSAQAAARLATAVAVVTVEGHHEAAAFDVAAAGADLRELLERYVPGCRLAPIDPTA